jgi:hypothetical protein
MVLTMAAVAAAKDMPAHGFSVKVKLEPGNNHNGKGGVFESDVVLSERFTPREQRILYNSARSCEVHNLLQGPLEFRESLSLNGSQG